MDTQISARLIELNYQFYQTFASSFSVTRYSVQPGVRKIADEYLIRKQSPAGLPILDLGCGNGILARYLDENHFSGNYLGVDASPGLLGLSENKVVPPQFALAFQVLDITAPGWETQLPAQTYHPIVSFAVFHHIPGTELRVDIFRKIRRLLPPGGIFILSNWQFMNSPKLSKRIIPWEKIGLSSSQVDPGDVLLDWRAEQGETGYRYVHNFTEDELKELALRSGFNILDSFYSDGSSGNLAIYQVWQAAQDNLDIHLETVNPPDSNL